MSAGELSSLHGECEVFCRYLTGAEPTDYVIEKYLDAHAFGSICGENGSPAFDRLLLALASKWPFATQIVDTYASVLFRNSSVRRKLILLLAILESCAPFHHLLDSVDRGPQAAIVFKMILKGLAWSIVFLTAVVMLLPLRALLGVAVSMYQRSAAIWKES